ncbi:Pls/PosA family non-ribosomal peptide synthetase [Donghicola mangrovi]|uniref:Amino acid adenylation domain-containing protein n=1 Tax=Donghicola mangrovi TaxID=2729614 RepID=A0A850QE18_9RHOB|nr:Pls/PosA family non-ribosomal peptide synthetase [Donghicola mangrovi]NVO24389.1 amino acid adenylation domain-containing protein [Donghicola mangrovi]
MDGQILLSPETGAPPPFVLKSGGVDTPRWHHGERLHHLFEARVDAAPDNVAVRTAEGDITFADLDARANRLAHYLLAQGFGPGDVIALLFDRCAESYIAMLAVLKINAAYVPLDPVFPADRIAYIAGDAGVSAILTQSAFRCMARAADLPVIALDTDEPEIAQMPAHRPPTLPEVSDLAYAIYTSGSTGRPKGVPIDHAMIVNFVRVAAETYGYTPEDRVYQGLTLAFDFSVEEIWVPLLAGASLVPNQSGASLVGEDLHAFLAEQRITAMCCVPTLLATLDAGLPDLRLVIVSGEACPADIVARWHSPTRAILNAYGPTEITVTATIAWPQPDQPVTIGRPLPTYSVVILDAETGEPLPQGAVGEICIGGIGLSRGYLGRDDLTAKAFVRDRIGLQYNPSGRIYRTGDLGRIADDGQIIYMGRIDTQVKIRGYRIELAEIESVIMQIEGVRQAVVNTHTPEGSEAPELVAYFTGTASAADIAATLRQSLPPFMVPAFYEPLDAIPMLPSDKADRKALPAPTHGRIGAVDAEYAAPETRLEADLANILAGIIGQEKVSVTADFFAGLGGNSLIMARFAAEIRSKLGYAGFSLKDLYRNPNIRAFAGHLGTDGASAAPYRRTTKAQAPNLLAYWGTGLYQVLASFAYLYAGTWTTLHSISWTFRAETMLTAYAHAAVASIGTFAFFSLAPVVIKWALIGRWQPTEIKLWSLDYCQFWTVKTLTRLSPLAMAPGTPLYTLYLRLLGAKIAWSALVQCAPPVVTDLFEVGENAVIGRGVFASGYVAEDGYIRTGFVRIEAGAFVGDGSVLGINTRIGAGTELGHASAVYDGQELAEGMRYVGSPAEPCTERFQTLANGPVSGARRVIHGLLSLGMATLVVGPASIVAMHFLYAAESHVPSAGAPASLLAESTWHALPGILMGTAALFLAGVLLLLANTGIVPRLAYLFLSPDRTYPLYGRAHLALGIVQRTSNSQFLNALFGDSSYVVPFLRAVGYRFNGMLNTGTNFGMMQKHDVPYLCEFGQGTMVSDNLTMSNAEFSAGRFRLGKVVFGAKSFLGNMIIAPTGMALGDNVLLATKVHVPLNGPRQQNTGLLGSPSFAIPRDHGRKGDFARYDDPTVRTDRIRQKNRYNLASMALFLLHHWGRIAMMATLAHFMTVELGLWSASGLTLMSMAMILAALLWGVLIEKLVLGFKRMTPQYCSVYDRYFWSHERYWKLSASTELQMLNGTPFKALFWRMHGVRFGRYVFDNGLMIIEKTMCRVGDLATFNQGVLLQGHSLEDGAFQSGPIEIGDRAVLGVNSFVHYGARVGQDAKIEADSFVMKAEQTPDGALWFGNPAQEAKASLSERPRIAANSALEMPIPQQKMAI